VGASALVARMTLFAVLTSIIMQHQQLKQIQRDKHAEFNEARTVQNPPRTISGIRQRGIPAGDQSRTAAPEVRAVPDPAVNARAAAHPT